MRHIVLDTETTGLSKQHDRVVEIAAVEFNPASGNTDDYYHVYLNPDKWMHPENVKVHGISNEFAATQPRFIDEAAGFVGFIRGARVYIHNAAFDIGMLDAEFKRLELDGLASYVESVVCTLSMARKMYPGRRNTLDALCDRFGVDRSRRKQHGALLDCQLLADVVPPLEAARDGREFTSPVVSQQESRLRALGRRLLDVVSSR